MERKEICNRIIDLKMKLIDEMVAEGAWSGHISAAEYLQDFRIRLLKICEDIQAMDNLVCGVKNVTKSIAWYLSTDYKALMDKVFRLNWEDRQEVYDIADALDDSFKDQLEKAVRELSYIYKGLCGRDLDDDIWQMVTDPQGV